MLEAGADRDLGVADAGVGRGGRGGAGVHGGDRQAGARHRGQVSHHCGHTAQSVYFAATSNVKLCISLHLFIQLITIYYLLVINGMLHNTTSVGYCQLNFGGKSSKVLNYWFNGSEHWVKTWLFKHCIQFETI